MALTALQNYNQIHVPAMLLLSNRMTGTDVAAASACRTQEDRSSTAGSALQSGAMHLAEGLRKAAPKTCPEQRSQRFLWS
jgi:hypothetical protein